MPDHVKLTGTDHQIKHKSQVTVIMINVLYYIAWIILALEGVGTYDFREYRYILHFNKGIK